MSAVRQPWRRVLAEPPAGAVHVALAAGETIGFAHGDASGAPPDRRFTAELKSLYILPAHQKTGAGHRLFEAT